MLLLCGFLGSESLPSLIGKLQNIGEADMGNRLVVLVSDDIDSAHNGDVIQQLHTHVVEMLLILGGALRQFAQNLLPRTNRAFVRNVGKLRRKDALQVGSVAALKDVEPSLLELHSGLRCRTLRRMAARGHGNR